MGFNKRFLKKENIIINQKNLIKYLTSDVLICTDDFSRKVLKMYEEGESLEKILDFINNN
jgi:hypothetical protein